MSLGANLLSIFVPSYFLTVTKLPEEKPFLCGASSRIRTYDLLITRELHYHCAIEAFGSLMGIEPTTTRATTWHSTN